MKPYNCNFATELVLNLAFFDCIWTIVLDYLGELCAVSAGGTIVKLAHVRFMPIVTT